MRAAWRRSSHAWVWNPRSTNRFHRRLARSFGKLTPRGEGTLGAGTDLSSGGSRAGGSREGIVADYAALGLTLGRHPLALLRGRLRAAALKSASDLQVAAHGTRVRTAGIVLMRQRPATASGVTFLTLEDESGQVNVIVWERTGQEQRAALLESRLLEVHGEVQHQEGICHLIAHRLIDRTALLGELLTRSRDFH